MSDDSVDKWAMPKPIFRSSTGELVVPTTEAPVDPEPDTIEPAGPAAEDDPLAKLYAPPEGLDQRSQDAPMAAKAAAPAIVIEEQPVLADDLGEAADLPAQTRVAEQKGGTLMLLLGAIFLLAAAAGFTYLIYYLFFASGPDSSGF